MPVRKDGVCTGKCKAFDTPRRPSVHANLKRPVPVPDKYLADVERDAPSRFRRGGRRRWSEKDRSPAALDRARWAAWHEGVLGAPGLPEEGTLDRHYDAAYAPVEVLT